MTSLISTGSHNPCACPGTSNGTPPTPPSSDPNPPPPRPNFTCDELQTIVIATGTGTALTSGGAAGGALIRLVAMRGLARTDTATQIEEGRDFIHWFFGPTSWMLDQIPGTTAGEIIFRGQPATTTLPSPILAVHHDGRLFRGDSRHLIFQSTGVEFDFAYNQRPNIPRYKMIKVFLNGNWVDAP